MNRVVMFALGCVALTSCGNDADVSGNGGDEAGEGGAEQSSSSGRGGNANGDSSGTASTTGGTATAGMSADGNGATTLGGEGPTSDGGSPARSGGAPVSALGGAAGEPSVAGGGDGGAGGADASCVEVVGAMPASPLSPSDARCASGCALPPMDGKTLNDTCGLQSDPPPANAIGAPGEDPPGTVVGVPCDVGWCAKTKLKTITVGAESFGGPYWETVNMVMAFPETAHLARFQQVYDFTYTALNASGTVGGAYMPDAEKYATWAPPAPFDPNGTGGWYLNGAVVYGPLVGADGAGHVYLAYAGAAGADPFGGPPQQPPLTGPRFGTQVGSDWTFEDMPATWTDLESIQVDGQGAAVVVHRGAVYRHLAGGGFERTAIPCGVNVKQLVIEATTGVWYLLSKTQTLYRRATDGTWTSEAAPYDGRLLVAGGTLHIDAAGVGIVHRVGTTWSQPLLPPFEIPFSTSQYSVAVDTCWAPHFGFTRTYGDFSKYQFERVYTRWTARGFLSLLTYTGDFVDVAVVAGTDHAFVHANGQVDVIPLR